MFVQGCGEKKTQSFYDVHAKEYAGLTVKAEDVLPSGREKKWLNVVWGKRWRIRFLINNWKTGRVARDDHRGN